MRLGDDPEHSRGYVDAHGDLGEDTVKVDLSTYVRRAVWGMLKAKYADMLSKSADGLAKVMAVIVIVVQSAGLTVLRNESGDHAAADIEPGTLGFTVRRKKRWSEVYADDTGSVRGRACRYMRLLLRGAQATGWSNQSSPLLNGAETGLRPRGA